MDDYEKFVQHLLPSLRINEEDKTSKHSAASSVIRFYGQPILPPLLSGARRVEMQQHRDAAQNAAAHRKLKFESKMAHVQNILASVQVRSTPTLEEVLQEPDTLANVTFPHKGSNGSALHSSHFARSKHSLLLSSSPCSSQNNGASVCPLTSTAYSAFLSSDVTPQLNNRDRCLTSQQESQPTFISGVSHHQSASSGYLTCENVGSTTILSGGVDTGKERQAFGSSEGACDVGSSFFLLNTSNTIGKMPDIISHPPIDGEELEKSGLESPCCRDFLVVRDISCSPQQHDSITCERRRDESVEGEDYLSVSTLIDLDKDNSLDVNSVLSDSPESSHAQGVCHHSSAESSVQHEPTEPADDHAGEGEPSAHPHRLSLQALLRRSQECRRRQRMLRNQAKNVKIQERTQAEARTRTEEPSLSDKENDELLPESAEASEGKRPKENRGAEKTLPHQRKIAPKFFWEKTNLNSESTHWGRDESSNGGRVGTTFESSKVSVSPDVDTKVTSASTHKTSLLPASSPVQRALHLINSPTAFYRGGKFNTIPVPSVSRSPVGFRSTFPADAMHTLVTFLNGDHKAGEVEVEQAASPSVQRVLATSSLHIDQLELNLSGLKAMISDLESTLAGNLGRQSQSEFVSEGSGHSEEVLNDPQGRQPLEKLTDCQQDKAGGLPGSSSSCSSLGRFPKELRRASLGDTGAESGVGDTDDHPLVKVQAAEAVDVSELRLVKSIAAQRAKEKTTDDIHNKGRTDAGSGVQQPTARSLLGETQRLQIPQVLRVLPSEGGGTRCHFPATSGGGDLPAEGRSESTAGGRGGLNRSYEVESPSDLWLHEASAGAHRSPESGLTPESGGDGQGGVSKVKRRLLMQVAGETTGGSDGRVDGCCTDGAGPQQEAAGRGDEQETLTQAHAAQIRALRTDHRRQQEELLQPLPELSDRYRPLLLAAVKGFLTRRLLRSERVAQLVRTVQDTQQLLQTLNPGSRQDVLLQERVTLQLRAARYEVSDIFFGLSTSERMQLIGWDREAAREKELRRQSGQARRKSSLSAATQKSLERKKERMLQKKAAGRHRGAVARGDRGAGSSAQQPQQTKGGRLKADPQRVPKSTYSSRPR
ncbi:uncharacterized protein cp110 isoform X2 [Nelusetta ayraudi]|uniref:uncharacterized protein cp110 isoform X2 n=1 Tax=Nelusetta ayraudi TaxID=303726 RepID=UPI003F70794D